MTLDDFLRALENLIEERETSDDDPGEGNFSCEDCRACNHCRFCIGCDSCEDCTYCDECIDCSGGTQSKRCVSCEKFSYCEDSRECKNSRYLTLCVSCSDCVHCLACVGLDGGEFFVLNEKRTRKEYFAVLRQVQELMQVKMSGGWRPPGIGLASEIFDALIAERDTELTAAPWLGPGSDQAPVEHDYRGEPALEHDRHPGRARPRDGWDEPRGYEAERRPQSRADPREPGRELESDPQRDPRRGRDPARDHLRDRGPSEYGVAPSSDPAAPRGGRDWVHEPPPPYGSSYAEDVDDDRGGLHDRGRARPRPDYGGDLGRDLGRDFGHEYDGNDRSDRPRRPAAGHGYDPDEHDVPHKRDQQPTEPFARGEREPAYDPSSPRRADYDHVPVERERPRADSRERTVARADRRVEVARVLPDIVDDLHGLELPPDADLPPDNREPETRRARTPETPKARESEPSSPWLDDNAAQTKRRAKRGSLRRAGRPERPPDAVSPRDASGTGSYRTGSAPERSRGEGTHTGSGLRLGRKPKRRG